MIVLDTNVVSELMHPRGSSVVRQWVAAQPITNLFTTTMTQAEILYGIALLPSGKRQADAQIASICYTRQATLATRNVSDFEGCGIAIVNPWESE